MEETPGEGEGGETITDIQNYLASFNKEIQDGGTTAAATTASGAEATSEPATEATAFYVAAPGTATAEGFQFEQGEVGFLCLFS